MSGWLGVELRHLSALAAVAEQQSFRGAADSLGYVQSAVSQRIAQLEQIVGARLVERSRGHRNVELTEAGRALLHHAERIEAQLSAARADLRSLTHQLGSPSLSVGVFGTLATTVLPQALALLAERFPDLRVETREALSDEGFFADTQSGSLDVAFGELPLAPGPFQWRELLTDPTMLVVPTDSPLAHTSQRPTLKDIVSGPIVAYRAWRMFTHIEARFAAAGLELDTPYSAHSPTAVQALVAAGLGNALMPQTAIDPDDPNTTTINLDNIIPSRTLVIYWSADRRPHPTLDTLIHTIQTVTAQQSNEQATTACVRYAA
jgi:molybdate transport repressor ModE-like protein